MIRLQPGDMDQVVTLLRPTDVTDAFGKRTDYVPVCDVAAAVQPLRGREFFAAAQTQAPSTLRVLMYWRVDVQSHWRLRWMGKLLEVNGAPIDINANHIVLELLCIEVPL